ncbi:MAG: MFS transporter, partial [Alteromonas sp.]|nr:MFS transporter [Alteromonas sp.]
QNLSTTSQMIGWSLSIFLLGMAIGQLVYGPLSQRFGKKTVLISCLVVFSIGGSSACCSVVAGSCSINLPVSAVLTVFCLVCLPLPLFSLSVVAVSLPASPCVSVLGISLANGTNCTIGAFKRVTFTVSPFSRAASHW